MEIYKKPIGWLRGEGDFASVVVSTRVRLARNLSNYPFITSVTPQQAKEIDNYLVDKVSKLQLNMPFTVYRLHEMDDVDRRVLFERHLISSEHLNSKLNRSVAITENERVSIMINEEDHIRLQSLESSFNPKVAFEATNCIDDILSEVVSYAYDSKYGYVTCCPTNIGTGLRVSVMMHLPAIVYTKQIEKVIQSLTRVSYTIRGFYGEGTSPLGNFFQVSNQTTLGRSEQDIIEELVKVIPEIVRFETTWREKLSKDQGKNLENTIWRAYGVLKSARSITSEEALELLSAIRLGVNMKLIESVPLQVVNELFIMVQPGHLQKIYGQQMKEGTRDITRADLIREKLNKF
ncbi:MAG: protein arginine kinase [Planctomycetes bacterium]|nr:protein arginine kinase [Planctomycetota bacterium]